MYARWMPPSAGVTRRLRSALISRRSGQGAREAHAQDGGLVSSGFSPRNIAAWDLPIIWMLPIG